MKPVEASVRLSSSTPTMPCTTLAVSFNWSCLGMGLCFSVVNEFSIGRIISTQNSTACSPRSSPGSFRCRAISGRATSTSTWARTRWCCFLRDIPVFLNSNSSYLSPDLCAVQRVSATVGSSFYSCFLFNSLKNVFFVMFVVLPFPHRFVIHNPRFWVNIFKNLLFLVKMSKKNLIHCLYHIKTMFVYHSPRFRPTASTFPPPLVPVDTKERENTIYFSPLNTTTKKNGRTHKSSTSTKTTTTS